MLQADLTELKESGITFDPGTSTVAGCNLHAVADSWCQTGNNYREGGSIDGLVHVVTAFIPEAPDLVRDIVLIVYIFTLRPVLS